MSYWGFMGSAMGFGVTDGIWDWGWGTGHSVCELWGQLWDLDTVLGFGMS